MFSRSFSGFWRRNYSATAQNDRQTADPSGNGTGNASVNGETDTGSGKTEKQADDSVDVAAQLKETIAKHNEEVKEIRVSSRRRRMESLRSRWEKFRDVPRRWMSRFFFNHVSASHHSVID